MKSSDFLIIGGGIVGICLARELRRRFSDQSVVLIEKEADCGRHASGRNSGVIHAGFYYSADSLKARFTRAGNLALHAYCEEKGLPVLRCGKLVVAKDEGELPLIDELLRRGRANGVPVEKISEEEARKIEPRAKTWGSALFSPSTSSADPRQVLAAMRADAESEGVEILTGAAYRTRKDNTIVTAQGPISFGHAVNAAGLYADKIARDFGFSRRYRILPFKGLYLYSDEPPGALRAHIYPVPDLRNPFLGVHFTLTADGHIKIGPTAIPAFWREQYHGLQNFHAREFLEILAREAALMISSDFDFKKLALEELAKRSRAQLVALAARLAHNVRLEDFSRWGEPGIRAQLFDIETRRLVMDFVIEGDERSTHVLNAVSPGWTCAIPFAAHVAEQIAGRRQANPNLRPSSENEN